MASYGDRYEVATYGATHPTPFESGYGRYASQPDSSPRGYIPAYSTPPGAQWGYAYPPPASPGVGSPVSPLSRGAAYDYPTYSSSPTQGALPPRPEFVGGSPPERYERRQSYGMYGSSPTDSKLVSRRRASQKAIDELVNVRLIDLPESDATCNICMEGYVEIKYSEDKPKREHPMRMTCGHVFGSGCLKQWLSQHNTCPTCRKELDFVEEQVEETSARARRGSVRSTGSNRNSRLSEDFHGLTLGSSPTARPQRQPTAPPRAGSYGAFDPPMYAAAPAPFARPQTGFAQGAAPPHPMGNRIQSHRHSRYASYAGPHQSHMTTAPFVRPASTASSAAATTQSTPDHPSYAINYPPAHALPPPPARLTAPDRRSTPFQIAGKGDLMTPRCGLESLKRCCMEGRYPSGWSRLECGHNYHRECLNNSTKERGDVFDKNGERGYWCERCRRHMPKAE
ncbi:hypothetical protein BJ508DRAFT_121245 [Ascobolus immersus RN42]|uniref:RING-type domain-containing protein n=1 Tax=Ascobolus immersus RN42 TaxID=1160509 RepID=A0A3N4IMD6_ASCIM|nr:hypothetical protein BJ508DRAFT_121245 [Ascobolus immersus RN42]